MSSYVVQKIRNAEVSRRDSKWEKYHTISSEELNACIEYSLFQWTSSIENQNITLLE